MPCTFRAVWCWQTEGSKREDLTAPQPTEGPAQRLSHGCGFVSPRPHLAMFGDMFCCHHGEAAAGISWAEARDAADHPTVLGTVP